MSIFLYFYLSLYIWTSRDWNSHCSSVSRPSRQSQLLSAAHRLTNGSSSPPACRSTRRLLIRRKPADEWCGHKSYSECGSHGWWRRSLLPSIKKKKKEKLVGGGGGGTRMDGGRLRQRLQHPSVEESHLTRFVSRCLFRASCATTTKEKCWGGSALTDQLMAWFHRGANCNLCNRSFQTRRWLDEVAYFFFFSSRCLADEKHTHTEGAVELL